MRTILIIDDEPRLVRLLTDYLGKNGYRVIGANDGMEGLNKFTSHRDDISLVIVDVMMPKLDGYQVCMEIRQTSNVPIIMLTAKSEEKDELMGYDLKIDDYIRKPFSLRVLVARINNLIKRCEPEIEPYLDAGDIHIDNTAHEVTVNGEIVQFPLMQYKLLVYFIQNQGKAIAREKIFNDVWGYNIDFTKDTNIDCRTVDTHVKLLRKKINRNYIKTLQGLGYKFSLETN